MHAPEVPLHTYCRLLSLTMDGQTGSWFGLVVKRVMSLANSVERFFPIFFDFARSLRGQSPPRMIPERPITGLVRLAGGSEPGHASRASTLPLRQGSRHRGCGRSRTIMISVPAGQTKHPIYSYGMALTHVVTQAYH